MFTQTAALIASQAVPNTNMLRILQSIPQILGAACLIAISAQISIPLPFSPVPLTAQTLMVLLVGAVLGSRKGALSVLTYLGMACMGLPVLAGGCNNPLAFFGPTGGYCLGFILQAYLVGWLIERQSSPNSLVTFAALLAACAVQLGLGTLWLSHLVGTNNALWMGFYPFIPGEFVKSALAAYYLKSR